MLFIKRIGNDVYDTFQRKYQQCMYQLVIYIAVIKMPHNLYVSTYVLLMFAHFIYFQFLRFIEY